MNERDRQVNAGKTAARAPDAGDEPAARATSRPGGEDAPDAPPCAHVKTIRNANAVVNKNAETESDASADPDATSISESSAAPAPVRPDAAIVQLFLGSEGGGIITAVNQWAPALREAGWNLHAVVMRREGQAVDMLRAVGVHPVTGRFSRIDRVTRLPGLLRALNASVVHTHNPAAQWWGSIAARRIGAKIFRTVHADMFEEMKGSLPGWRIAIWKHLMARMIRSADGLAVVSPHLIDRLPLPRGFDARRISVMPNGYDPTGIETSRDPLPEPVRAFLGDDLGDDHGGDDDDDDDRGPAAADRALLVLSMGRLVPVKNFSLLLRAFATVAREFPRARLILGGSGPQQPHLEELKSSLQLDENVLLLPWIQEIAPFLRRADVVAISSVSECCPMLILEAMSAARPVVATRVGGIPHMIRDAENGLLVDAEDEAGLAEAIAALLRDPERRRAMGRANRAELVRRFSPSTAARAIAVEYNRLLAAS